MTHLTRDEQLQAVEGVLVARRHVHVDRCPACRAEVDALRAVVHAVRDTPVPEPSPLFWEHFSARVREAVAEEPPPRRPSWWLTGWRPFVASLSAAALVVVLGVMWVSNRGTSDDRLGPATIAASASATADEERTRAADEEWGFLLAVADASAWTDDDGLAWSSRPGQAELTLPDLTNEEQAALVALLQDAMATPGPRSPNRPG